MRDFREDERAYDAEAGRPEREIVARRAVGERVVDIEERDVRACCRLPASARRRRRLGSARGGAGRGAS
jgi:hypothetical protein